MSLLSPEQVRLFLGPSEVLGVRLSGWRPRVVRKCRKNIAAAAEGTPWSGYAVALEAAAAELAATGAAMTVILSSHLARYRLVPWDDALASDKEETAFAHHGFLEAFGSAAENWSVQVSEEPPGQPRVACAVDEGLLAVVRASLGKFTPARKQSARSYLMTVFNAWLRQLAARHTGWLVLAEPGKLCLSFIENGSWRWVRVVSAADNWAAELAELLERESLVAGTGYLPAPVAVFDPTALDLPMTDGKRLSVRKLQLPAIPGYSPAGDIPFGLALA